MNPVAHAVTVRAASSALLGPASSVVIRSRGPTEWASASGSGLVASQVGAKMSRYSSGRARAKARTACEFGQLGLRVRCCASSAHQGLKRVAEFVGDGRGDEADEIVRGCASCTGKGPHAHPVSDGLHRQRGKSVGGQDVAAGLNDVVERGASRGSAMGLLGRLSSA